MQFFFDGKEQSQLPNEYGENDFLVTYDNKYYFSFRHFKRNRRHQHDYHFHFFQKENHLFFRAKIQGKDEKDFEGEMREIDFSYKYRGNVPIEIDSVE